MGRETWECAFCKHTETAPTDSKAARTARGNTWTKIDQHNYLCPQCTRCANRDCDKETRQSLQIPDTGREREQALYHTWWTELLASRPP